MKYNNSKKVYKDVTYDSKLEADYAKHLDGLIVKKMIKSVKRQIPLQLLGPGGKPVGRKRKLIVDFEVEFLSGKKEYHDTKGCETEISKLKRQILECRGIFIKIIQRKDF